MHKLLFVSLSTFLMLGLNAACIDTAYAGITSVTHKVVRSDGSQATKDDKHEFNGGSRSFFENINEPSTMLGWVEDVTESEAYREGWVRIYLDWPVTLKSIVLHKATTGDKSIGDGWVNLEVQTVKGKWVRVFNRQAQDVKKPVSISKELQAIGPTKGVRITFRSPTSIRVGPIDLNF
ncbi:hypothetical protein Ga0123462_1485 [Mariprofundus ferrinatatus]|uniref:F5/8 type C domain-containing protein n=1 Tax=Mariprofundus ferrinatatus TaxID=1921087 RepID=A0A2K8L4V3_9PROT|nr:hypothetical protein [Mariprofundus ferrinatatus]ATX82348.1 hypothetical protein Ga0123462_1485 [Mariprofundus ferrinatatus]